MKTWFLILCLFFINAIPVYSFQIVYPKSKNVTIDSNCTFFIGNETGQKQLKINGENVKLYKTGAFKYPVDLKPGENIFTIDNGIEKQTYKIIKPVKKTEAPDKSIAKYYNSSKYIELAQDNVPLRSTPIDGGLNRLQHLQKGIVFEAIGEQNGFYKVKLARDDFAWIPKDSANMTSQTNNSQAKLISHFSYETLQEHIYIYKFDKKVPYILYECNGLDLTIYNISGYDFGKVEAHISNAKLFGYNSSFNENNELIIKINKPITNFKDLKITIDPGHGGNEYGAIGCLGEKEKDINLKIALLLRERLLQSGAKVFMTREDDSYVSLSDRVKFANEHNSQIFISIHANALPDSLAKNDIRGVEVYYFYPQAKPLASKILNAISLETKLDKNRIIPQSFAVIRNTQNVSILIETGYIIDPQDEEKLIDENIQKEIVNGIIRGLENYLNDI